MVLKISVMDPPCNGDWDVLKPGRLGNLAWNEVCHLGVPCGCSSVGTTQGRRMKATDLTRQDFQKIWPHFENQWKAGEQSQEPYTLQEASCS